MWSMRFKEPLMNAGNGFCRNASQPKTFFLFVSFFSFNDKITKRRKRVFASIYSFLNIR
jgi:hypothetical protein